MRCRHCGKKLEHVFLDLGFAPPSNSYLGRKELLKPETYFPLKLYVCDNCWLVQTEDFTAPEDLFKQDYAYFSSTSESWLNHAEKYSSMIRTRLSLQEHSLVLEVGCNDGYLLQYFQQAGIPCLGVDPAGEAAEAAERIGVPVLRRFFCEDLAKSLQSKEKQADLIVCNNVYAHVPDINDFTRGLKVLLKPEGVVTIEFPHLMRLIEECQFDTVYHEHYSYLCLHTVRKIFSRAGLRVWDVQELQTHGGSLRIFGCHEHNPRPETQAVADILAREKNAGLLNLDVYKDFQARAENIKDSFLLFLINQKRQGRKLAAYGAAAKGNTLLNFAGVKPDLLPLVCDAAPSKQGKFMPGSHIPIFPPEKLDEFVPDVVFILPWNLRREIMSRFSYLRKRGTRFAAAIPELQIYESGAS